MSRVSPLGATHGPPLEASAQCQSKPNAMSRSSSSTEAEASSSKGCRGKVTGGGNDACDEKHVFCAQFHIPVLESIYAAQRNDCMCVKM